MELLIVTLALSVVAIVAQLGDTKLSHFGRSEA